MHHGSFYGESTRGEVLISEPPLCSRGEVFLTISTTLKLLTKVIESLQFDYYFITACIHFWTNLSRAEQSGCFSVMRLDWSHETRTVVVPFLLTVSPRAYLLFVVQCPKPFLFAVLPVNHFIVSSQWWPLNCGFSSTLSWTRSFRFDRSFFFYVILLHSFLQCILVGSFLRWKLHRENRPCFSLESAFCCMGQWYHQYSVTQFLYSWSEELQWFLKWPIFLHLIILLRHKASYDLGTSFIMWQ